MATSDTGMCKCRLPKLEIEKCISAISVYRDKVYASDELREALFNLISSLHQLIGLYESETDSLIKRLSRLTEEPGLDIIIKELPDIESLITDLLETIDVARSSLRTLAAGGLISRNCLNKIEKYLDCVESLIEEGNQKLLELSASLPRIELTNLSDILGSLLGLPYFTANLHGGFMSVRINEGVRVRDKLQYVKKENKCKFELNVESAEEKEDDNVVALYRLTPLSIYEPEGGKGLAYTLIPPARRRPKGETGLAFNVSFGYIVRWRNGLYPCNCINRADEDAKDGKSKSGRCGNRSCQDVEQEMLKRLVQDLMLPDAKAVPRRINLGLDFSTVNVPEYESGLKTLLCSNAPVLLAYRVSITRAGRTQQGYWLIFGLEGYDANEGILPVAVCNRGEEPKIFIGTPRITTGSEETIGVLRARCPLVELYRSTSDTNVRSMLKAICKNIEGCAYSQSERDGYVYVSDVYSYMVRTKPLLWSFINKSMGIRRVRHSGVDGEVARVDASMAYNTVVIEARFIDERLYYPLPFWLEARILSTYAFLFNIDKDVTQRATRLVLEEFEAYSGEPSKSRLVKSLFVRTVLAAGGIYSHNTWKSLTSKINQDECSVAELRGVLSRIVRGAYIAAWRAYMGESYALSLSGLKRATELLLDLAVSKICSNMSINDVLRVFVETVTRGEVKNIFENYVSLATEMSLAHLVVLSLVRMFGEEENLRLIRVRRGPYKYALIETRQGGLGFIPTLTEENLAQSLSQLPSLISNVAGRITGQHGASVTVRVSPQLEAVNKVVRETAYRVAAAYGQLSSRTGDVGYTYIPSWLARLPLTEKRIKDYAALFGVDIPSDISVTLRIVHHELVGAYFDTDFIDASQYDIGGINSWLGEYERKVLLSSQLGLLAMTGAR